MAAHRSAGFILIYILTRPLAHLPLGFHRACGRRLGRFMGKILRYRRDVVMTNLARSFPEKKYDELKDICNRSYEHLATIFCEAIWFGGCRNPERLQKAGIVEIIDPGKMNEYHDSGRSVCVMTTHIGNWELYGGYRYYTPGCELKYGENDICVVYKEPSSSAWAEFMAWNRLVPLDDPEGFEGMLESMKVMRYAVSHRNEPKIYHFNTDQYPYSPRGVIEDIEFMGQKSRAMSGAASLAHSFGMAVLYLNMRIDENGNYKWIYTPICSNAAEMSAEDIVREYYKLLEKDLREQPWNYLWTHKRWK